MLELNIYKNQKEVEKTYRTEAYDLMYGTVEDVVDFGRHHRQHADLRCSLKNREKNQHAFVGCISRCDPRTNSEG